MTREEAIKIFNTVLFLGKCDCPKEEIEECLKMAIKALEQEPTTKNSLGVDAISRQAAIDAIRRIHPVDTDYDCTLLDKVDVMYVLNELPSVTPQEPKIFPIAEIKYDKDKLKELVNKAVLTVAPQEPQIFKWCDTCREYDQEKHCCHRWSKVIRDTVEEMKQEPILEQIRAEVIKYEGDCRLSVDEYPSCKQCTDNVFETIYAILDKYKAESETQKSER